MTHSVTPGSREVFAGYDLWSPAYDELDNPLIHMAEHALAALLPEVRGAAVVELGCGTGRNALPLLGAGASRYVGIDGSAGMLAQARARGLDARVRFRQDELAALPPADERELDSAIFCLVLEHTRELAPAFAAAAARLRPGGRLVLVELDAGLHADGVGAHFEHQSEVVRLPSYAHSEAELGQALVGAGFEVTSARRWYACRADAAACAKLARYLGRAVVIEMHARRS